jgi:hypothetical protein
MGGRHPPGHLGDLLVVCFYCGCYFRRGIHRMAAQESERAINTNKVIPGNDSFVGMTPFINLKT